jgi:Tol biopolymer transport system component
MPLLLQADVGGLVVPLSINRSSQASQSLLFVDGGVADYQTLVAGVSSDTEVHLLDSSQDAVTQITNTLLGRSGISSLHIVSHGEAGGLDFGSRRLNLSDLPEYAAQLQSWSKALSDDADILLYGCNVAQGEVGKAFTSILSQLTGADVAASDDLTGSSAQSGNWTLEVNTGQIAASLAFQSSVLSNYQPVLAVDLLSRADPTIPNDSASGSINPGSISSDGRYVVFTSGPDNLVTNDSNGATDVFVRDLMTDTTTLVSTTGTTSGNNSSSAPVVSADGRYVAFTSTASNLVANDTNNTQDVFVRDLVNGTTTLVSTTGTASGNSYSANPVVSADGRYVAFTSEASNLVANDSNGSQDVFVRDLVNGTTTLVSTTGTSSGNSFSFNPVVSADGRYVAFDSRASNLVANDSNGSRDVFVRDLVNGTTTLVSTTGTADGNNDSDNPVVSADGRYVAFTSTASNLVANDSNNTQDVFVRDRVNGTTMLVSTTGTASGNSYSDNPVVSANGRYVAFLSLADNLVANDSNNTQDVFVRDLVTGTTMLVSTTGTASGNSYSGNPAVSADGRYVAFTSYASNLVANDSNGNTPDVFVRDLVTGTTTLVSTTGTAGGNQNSYNPVVSADGRYVAFTSYASNLVANDSNSTQDVFLYDRTAASTTLVSRRAPSLPYLSGNDSSRAYSNQSLSADGRYVAFTSKASNLVANDSNSTISGTINDVFVRDRVNSTTTLVSTTGTAGGNSDSSNPVVSADGRYVAFTSRASNLVANDSNGTQDVFVRDLVNGMTTLVSTTGTASGNSDSSNPVVSADGRYVAFTSRASNLVANDSNGTQDVFVRNLVNGTTTLVSTTGTSSGNGYSANPVISADGRYVAFTSYASNLVANDTNSTQDVFVRDLVNGMTTLVSTTSTASGNSYSDNPVVSADGRYVAFDSLADNLVANDSNGSQDVFVRDLVNGTTTLVSTTGTASGNSHSNNPVVSADGRYVVFLSDASNLVANDSNGSQDVFVRDLVNGTTTLVSTTGTSSGNNQSYNPVASADGRYVAFSSYASDLVANDSNGTVDVFLRDLVTGTMTLVSNTGSGSGNSDSFSPVVSADGRYIAFTSRASNLVVGDYNGTQDVFGSALNNDAAATLLWRNGTTGTAPSGTGENVVWQLQDFTLQNSYYMPTVADLNWQIISTADFDRNGFADIVWRNQATGENALWQMNSSGYQTGYFITAVADVNWRIMDTGDFNADGTADLVWRNQVTGQNAIWQMNGFNIQTTAFLTTVADVNWQIVSTADFDNDGKTDLLWRNQATGENAIWQMNGFATKSTFLITRVADTNWQVAGTADLNSDGIADLVWRNRSRARMPSGR